MSCLRVGNAKRNALRWHLEGLNFVFAQRFALPANGGANLSIFYACPPFVRCALCWADFNSHAGQQPTVITLAQQCQSKFGSSCGACSLHQYLICNPPVSSHTLVLAQLILLQPSKSHSIKLLRGLPNGFALPALGLVTAKPSKQEKPTA